MKESTKVWLKVIGAGIVVGATAGVIIRFATDGKTLKYAAFGAGIGVIGVVSTNLAFMYLVPPSK